MAILTKPSFASSTAIVYITAGALLDVWTTVYYFTFMQDGDSETRRTVLFWLAGFFLTGLTLMVIGFALGRIGRAARQAEMPPPEVTPQAAQAEMTAATAPVVVPTASLLPPTTTPQPAAPQPARPPVGNLRAQV